MGLKLDRYDSKKAAKISWHCPFNRFVEPKKTTTIKCSSPAEEANIFCTVCASTGLKRPLLLRHPEQNNVLRKLMVKLDNNGGRFYLFSYYKTTKENRQSAQDRSSLWRDGILGHQFMTRKSNVLLHAIHSPFYLQILKKTILYSGYNNPYKKFFETRKLESILE